MKFIVSRTSIWNEEESPCEEARRDSVPYVESYNFKTPEEFDKSSVMRREGSWLSVGTNHRLNKKGHITRDNGIRDVWSIEINSIEELIEFVNKYGEIVVQDDFCSDYKEIEIYDDWRE